MKFLASIKKIALPLLLLCIIGSMYIRTLPQSIGYGDAGLLAAAATSLGVPHPPGFPSYMILAHLFTLLPFGSLLFRLEILSVLSSLLLISLLFWYLKKNTSTIVAFFSCLALAGSYSFWSQSQNVETFILTNLVIITVLILVEQNENQKKNMVLAGILFGIGLGFNPIIIAILPSVIYSSFAKASGPDCAGRLAKLVLFSCVAGVIATIAYSYLPLRAATHPFVNWSDPSTFERFISHVTGGGLSVTSGSVVNGFTGSFFWFVDAWLRFFVLFAQNFTILLIPIMALGGYQMWKKNKIHALAWGILIVTNISLAGLYTSGNRDSWFITSFIALSYFLAHGIQYLFTLVKKQSHLVSMLLHTLLCAWCLIPAFVWYGPMLTRASDTASHTYINDLYYKLPDNAILIGGGETFNSLTAFAHEALKFRPGVIPVDFTIYYGKEWYRKNISLSFSRTRESRDNKTGSPIESGMTDTVDMPKFTDELEFSRILEQFVDANNDRPIFVTGYLLTQPIYANTFAPAYIPQSYTLRQHGIVYELVDPMSLDSHETLESTSLPSNIPFLETNYIKAIREIRREYALALEKEGDRMLEQHDKIGAFELYDKAGVTAPEYFDQNRLREKMAIPTSPSAVPNER